MLMAAEPSRHFQVVEEIHAKDHVATQLTKAFQGASHQMTVR